MFSSSEQFSRVMKSASEAALRCTAISLAGFERSMKLQKDAVMRATGQSAEDLKTALSNGGDYRAVFGAWSRLCADSLEATLDLWREHMDIARRTQTELAQAIGENFTPLAQATAKSMDEVARRVMPMASPSLQGVFEQMQTATHALSAFSPFGDASPARPARKK